MKPYENYTQVPTLAAIPQKVLKQLSVDPKEYIKLGIDALKEEHWDLAYSISNEVCQIAPDNSEATLGKLLACNQKNVWDQASELIFGKPKTVNKNPVERYFNADGCLVFGSLKEKSTEEPIEWQVLARQGNKMLVLSKYALEARAFHKEWKATSWQNCNLRKWLNSAFVNEVFTDRERAMIMVSLIESGMHSKSNSVSETTYDKLFLLSVREADQYLKGHKAKECKPTKRAHGQGAKTNMDGNCWWWLRTMGQTAHSATDVLADGTINYVGSSVDFEKCCVRPAMWVDLDK